MLRGGPFEDAFQGFQPVTGSPEVIARQRRFQDAVSGLFARLNKTFLTKQFEFSGRRDRRASGVPDPNEQITLTNPEKSLTTNRTKNARLI
jgi:hypothetical protein